MSGKLLGGWQISGITQFQTGTPSSVAVGTDYVGVGQDGSMSGGGQFWVKNGDPTIVGEFAANGANEAKYWFSTKNSDGTPIFTQPVKGTFNSQEGDPQHPPQPRVPELEHRTLQEVRDQRADRLPVPCTGVQRLEPPELERRQLQPDQQCLRQDHRQDG